MGHFQIWRHIFTYQKILHQFKDFRNQNFSVFWLKKPWTMEMKQNQTFSIGHIQVWHHFSLVARYLHTLMPFIFDIFFKFIAKVSTNKWREIELNSTSANLTIFSLIYKVVHYLNEFWNLFLDMDYLKNEWQQLERKNVLNLISIYKC